MVDRQIGASVGSKPISNRMRLIESVGGKSLNSSPQPIPVLVSHIGSVGHATNLISVATDDATSVPDICVGGLNSFQKSRQIIRVHSQFAEYCNHLLLEYHDPVSGLCFSRDDWVPFRYRFQPVLAPNVRGSSSRLNCRRAEQGHRGNHIVDSGRFEFPASTARSVALQLENTISVSLGNSGVGLGVVKRNPVKSLERVPPEVNHRLVEY